jgi:hypothetical protein
MAQLNTTVENIQLKENMIIAGAAATAWESDSKYPSAKAVADKISAIAPGKIEHPVGSVLITSTNTNPSASVGGTWELIDKEYNTKLSAIEKNIKDEITKKAKKDNYDFVFAKSVVLYGGKDITDEIHLK